MYAQWILLTVTYDPNGATSSSAPSGTASYATGALVTVIGNTGGMTSTGSFKGWNTHADGTGAQYYAHDIFTMGSASVTLYAQWGTVLTYALRDTGPAGGFIFYNNSNGAVDGWYYLEAAPSDQSTNMMWWDNNIAITIGTSEEIGIGMANTVMIVNAQGAGTYAAKICEDLSIINGETTFSDWFLPSIDELDIMYNNLKVQGADGFTGDVYWSSSDVSLDNTFALEEIFSDVYAQYGYPAGSIDYGYKGNNITVRAVRKF